MYKCDTVVAMSIFYSKQEKNKAIMISDKLLLHKQKQKNMFHSFLDNIVYI